MLTNRQRWISTNCMRPTDHISIALGSQHLLSFRTFRNAAFAFFGTTTNTATGILSIDAASETLFVTFDGIWGIWFFSCSLHLNSNYKSMHPIGAICARPSMHCAMCFVPVFPLLPVKSKPVWNRWQDNLPQQYGLEHPRHTSVLLLLHFTDLSGLSNRFRSSETLDLCVMLDQSICRRMVDLSIY